MGVDPEQLGPPAGPPLGELLVARGLITPEQLEQALADQSETKRPLGEILIRLGFLSPAMVAQALATQQGRMIKSEYGFATGFDAKFSGTREAEPETPPALTPEPERPALAPLRIVGNVEPTLESQLAEAKADEAGVELRVALAAQEGLRAERDALLAERAQTPAEPVPGPVDESRHLLFFHLTGQGYLLVERPGPAPVVGSIVDVSADGGPASAMVTKVAQLALAGQSLRCAYLV
ncbi:MAG: hypothetical protein E6F98_02170 [Actinobacteria bacterium]|nr:MAG: hypothetical protein E6F98_02170 [Actinomycetota bacterium]